jgi:hypothetical protein
LIMTAGEASEPSLVTAAEFAACPLEGPIASLNLVDGVVLSQAYGEAAAASPDPCAQVYRLLSALCAIRLDPEARGTVWGAHMTFGDQRTMVPSDIKGAQSDVLEGILSQARHPALRARLADVVWSNDLRKGAVGKIAIDAYCDCIDGLISASLIRPYQMVGLDLLTAQRLAQRALQVGSATSKKGAVPDRVKDTIASLYVMAIKDGQHIAFARIAQLGVDYRLLAEKQVAFDAEQLALVKPETYPEAIRTVLDYAAHLYDRSGDTVSQQRCALAAVHQLLRMRDECPQAGAKASWVMDALLRLRHIRGQEAQDLEARLEDELRRLQRASLREMGSFSINLDKPELREEILETFAGFNLSTMLKSFALLGRSPKTEDLKAEELRRGKIGPLTSMMPVKHIDDEGKTVVMTDGAGAGEPPEEWFVRGIAKSEGLRRAILVANAIEPARRLMSALFTLEERHFVPIAWQSHFVPEIKAPIYAAGFAKFFQGDFMSAAHLLIPQLEPSLRHVLKAGGGDPTKRRDDSTEEDRSLDAIISNHRPALEAVLTQPLLDELNRVFNVKPGPALRHELAHGQVTPAECFAPDVIYACWLLYRICCLFLVDEWDERIRPSLETEEPGR